MRAAYIRWWGRLDGQRRHVTIRTGAKGHGYLLAETSVYPDDAGDVERVRRVLTAIAHAAGYNVVGDDWDQRPGTRRSTRGEQHDAERVERAKERT
jgi:hypothetical protein